MAVAPETGWILDRERIDGPSFGQAQLGREAR